jgi:hypothetical protein
MLKKAHIRDYRAECVGKIFMSWHGMALNVLSNKKAAA